MTITLVTITLANLQPGATWTFVHSDGRCTAYVYDREMAKGYQDPKSGYGLSPMHALLNPDTGKFAQVTERWMREAPRGSASTASGLQSHWLAVDAATSEMTETYVAEREARKALA